MASPTPKWFSDWSPLIFLRLPTCTQCVRIFIKVDYLGTCVVAWGRIFEQINNGLPQNLSA